MNTVAVLEISTKKARLALGSFLNNEPCLIHYEERPVADCFQSGVLSDVEGLSKIVASFKEISIDTNSSFNISEVHLIIPPIGLNVKENKSFTQTVNGTVEQIDVNNALALLGSSSKLNDHAIIDILPDHFITENGDPSIEAPYGKKSASLTVHAKIHLVPSTYVAPYRQVVEKAGIRVASISVSPMCVANYISTIAKFPSNYFYVDIGATMTIISFISKGALFSSKIHLIGGDLINNDLSERLPLDSEEIELIKRKAGFGARNSDYQAPIFVKRETSINEQVGKKISIVQKQFDEALKASFTHLDKEIHNAIYSIGSALKMKQEFLDSAPLAIGGGSASLQNIDLLLPNSCANRSTYIVRPTVIGARDPALVPLLGAIARRGRVKKKNETNLEAYHGVATLTRQQKEK